MFSGHRVGQSALQFTSACTLPLTEQEQLNKDLDAKFPNTRSKENAKMANDAVDWLGVRPENWRGPLTGLGQADQRVSCLRQRLQTRPAGHSRSRNEGASGYRPVLRKMELFR